VFAVELPRFASGFSFSASEVEFEEVEFEEVEF